MNIIEAYKQVNKPTYSFQVINKAKNKIIDFNNYCLTKITKIDKNKKEIRSYMLKDLGGLYIEDLSAILADDWEIVEENVENYYKKEM